MEIGKTKSTKLIIARLPVDFTVLILISNYPFYVTNCNLFTFQFLLIAISMVVQPIFLIKTSILVFTVAAGCRIRLGNIKKLTCWDAKLVVIQII